MMRSLAAWMRPCRGATDGKSRGLAAWMRIASRRRRYPASEPDSGPRQRALVSPCCREPEVRSSRSAGVRSLAAWMRPCRGLAAVLAVLCLSAAVLAGSLPLPGITGVEQQLVGIRGLSFEKPVQAEPATPAMIRAYLSRQMKATVDLPEWKTGLIDFGFVPPDFHPQRFLLQVLEQQVLAYYDPESKNFYYNEELMSSGSSTVTMTPDIVRTTWLHELDHALQDQHFDLSRIEKTPGFRHNQDFEEAVDALIEGDATLTMMYPAIDRYHLKLDAVEKLGPIMQNLSAGSTGLEGAPPVFSQGLAFPYAQGLQFVATLKEWGGWRMVNGAFKRLPRSTHQILHPEDFVLHPVQPVDFDFPEVPGIPVAADNVMGELGISILHKTCLPKATGDFSGWRGDRYRIYRENAGDVILWITQWNDPASAAAFMRADCDILGKRFPDRPLHDISPDEAVQGTNRLNWVKRNGNLVYTLENAPSPELAKWRERAFAIRPRPSTSP